MPKRMIKADSPGDRASGRMPAPALTPAERRSISNEISAGRSVLSPKEKLNLREIEQIPYRQKKPIKK